MLTTLLHGQDLATFTEGHRQALLEVLNGHLDAEGQGGHTIEIDAVEAGSVVVHVRVRHPKGPKASSSSSASASVLSASMASSAAVATNTGASPEASVGERTVGLLTDHGALSEKLHAAGIGASGLHRSPQMSEVFIKPC